MQFTQCFCKEDFCQSFWSKLFFSLAVCNTWQSGRRVSSLTVLTFQTDIWRVKSRRRRGLWRKDVMLWRRPDPPCPPGQPTTARQAARVCPTRTTRTECPTSLLQNQAEEEWKVNWLKEQTTKKGGCYRYSVTLTCSKLNMTLLYNGRNLPTWACNL